jgi:hypothetical protein
MVSGYDRELAIVHIGHRDDSFARPVYASPDLN